MKNQFYILFLLTNLLLVPAGNSLADNGYRISKINPATLSIPESSYIDTSSYSPEAVQAKMALAQESIPEGKVTLKPVKGLPEMRALCSGEGIFRMGLLQGDLPEVLYVEKGLMTIHQVSQAHPSLLIDLGNSRYLAKRPLVVGIDATLIIKDSILLLSEEKGVALVNGGLLFLYGGELTGWRETTGSPSYYSGDKSQFRPFFVSWGGSDTYFCQTRASHLGYFKTKSFGITLSTYRVKPNEKMFLNDNFDFHQPPRGWFINSTFSDIYYGFYCYEAEDVVIANNSYENNIVYGIDPHDRSKGLIIANNRVFGTLLKHGIILSRDVTDSFIVGNESYDNKISGIMLDRQCVRNEILGNTVYRNGGDGLSFYESGNNLIFENTILTNGAHGIRLRNSRNVIMINNNIIGNKSFGVYLHTRNLSDITRNISLDPYEQAVSGFLYGGTVSYNTSGSLYLSNYDEFTIYDVFIENRDSQKLRLGGDLKRYHNQVASSLSGGKHAVSLYKESE